MLRASLPPLRKEAPLLLAATLAQALPQTLPQTLPAAAAHSATAGALLWLAFRLLWRGLRPDAPPLWPGATFLAFLMRVALALGVWVMLVSLGFVALEMASAKSLHLRPDSFALIAALMIATPLTLALAVPRLPSPILRAPILSPATTSSGPPETAPRLGLLAALAPQAWARSALWLLGLVLPVCATALAAKLAWPAPFSAPLVTAALACTALTLAHLRRGLAPAKPGGAIFA